MNVPNLPVVILNEAGNKAVTLRLDTVGEECIANVPAGLEAGTVVCVQNTAGDFCGVGYFNQLSRLPLRLLTRENRLPDREFWIQSLQSALAFRHRFYAPHESFRIVFGDADRLPGLIVDKFGSVLSVQITTAGIERQKDTILDALQEVVQPVGIVLCCDSLPRKKEGLPLYRQIARGTVPDTFCAPVDGIEHVMDCLHGHKTGFFLDHRMNREWSADLSEGKRVLDLFCYSGAMGIRAGLKGADHVLCIDIFEPALKLGTETARLHGIGRSVEFRRAEAFSFLADGGNKSAWDLIFLDPPSFVRGSRRAQRNQANYRKIAALAVQALAPGGILVTSCCSFHVTRDDFWGATRNAFLQQGRDYRVFRVGSQSPDHPILPGVAGTDYLKCLFASTD